MFLSITSASNYNRHENNVLQPQEKKQQQALFRLLRQKRELERHVSMMSSTRSLLSVWHTIHVPLGVTLFVSIIVHIVATLVFRAGLFQ